MSHSSTTMHTEIFEHPQLFDPFYRRLVTMALRLSIRFFVLFYHWATLCRLLWNKLAEFCSMYCLSLVNPIRMYVTGLLWTPSQVSNFIFYTQGLNAQISHIYQGKAGERPCKPNRRFQCVTMCFRDNVLWYIIPCGSSVTRCQTPAQIQLHNALIPAIIRHVLALFIFTAGFRHVGLKLE